MMTLAQELFTLDETIRGQLHEASAATVSIQLLKRGFRFSAGDQIRYDHEPIGIQLSLELP